jgi:hypothetical protein
MSATVVRLDSSNLLNSSKFGKTVFTCPRHMPLTSLCEPNTNRRRGGGWFMALNTGGRTT